MASAESPGILSSYGWNLSVVFMQLTGFGTAPTLVARRSDEHPQGALHPHPRTHTRSDTALSLELGLCRRVEAAEVEPHTGRFPHARYRRPSLVGVARQRRERLPPQARLQVFALPLGPGRIHRFRSHALGYLHGDRHPGVDLPHHRLRHRHGRETAALAQLLL